MRAYNTGKHKCKGQIAYRADDLHNRAKASMKQGEKVPRKEAVDHGQRQFSSQQAPAFTSSTKSSTDPHVASISSFRSSDKLSAFKATNGHIHKHISLDLAQTGHRGRCAIARW